jgi:hypothetical protein
MLVIGAQTLTQRHPTLADARLLAYTSLEQVISAIRSDSSIFVKTAVKPATRE